MTAPTEWTQAEKNGKAEKVSGEALNRPEVGVDALISFLGHFLLLDELERCIRGLRLTFPLSPSPLEKACPPHFSWLINKDTKLLRASNYGAKTKAFILKSNRKYFFLQTLFITTHTH